MNWPTWWDWELEISPYVEKRMEERNFTELDLRDMMQSAHTLGLDEIEGRYVIQTRRQHHDWKIVVEPDETDQLLVVITAFPV